MNSSTSNSESALNQRQIFLRILLTILVGMSIAMGLARIFTESMGANSQQLLGRVLEAQEGLPRLLTENDEDLVIVFGSSMVDAAFAPRAFDQLIANKGGDVSSWNFGFGGLNPKFQNMLARRIADDFIAHDRRLKLLLVEFNPFQTTITRRERAIALEEPYVALLSSPDEILDRIFSDPASGLRIAEIRYLRDGISAEAVTTYLLSTPFNQPDSPADLGVEPDEAVDKRIGELFDAYFPLNEEEFPEFADCDWCYDRKGGDAMRSERSDELNAIISEYYELSQNEYRMASDRMRRIRTSDIEDLYFDEKLVVSFIQMVQTLSTVSDNIEVIMLPKNDDWISNSADAMQRQTELVARIERETGVPVRDFQKIEQITNDMFSDTTHLNGLEGQEAFTRFLANEYGHLLAQ